MTTATTATRTADHVAVLDAPAWTRNHVEVRAVALAARYGTSAAWTRFATGATDGTWELLRVQSRTDCARHYLVTYCPNTDTILGCDCPALRVCWHRGSARLWVERRKVRAAMAERRATCEMLAAHEDGCEARRELTYPAGWVPAMAPGPDPDEAQDGMGG